MMKVLFVKVRIYWCERNLVCFVSRFHSYIFSRFQATRNKNMEQIYGWIGCGWLAFDSPSIKRINNSINWLNVHNAGGEPLDPKTVQ